MRIRVIFITGGVVSSLGKGITSASLASLIKQRGYRVSVMKLDPYLNVDPGTMNPYQHGEVFVTYDGAETDLDLGHYERFLDQNLTQAQNHTSGSIYQTVIQKERDGDHYQGQTVQIIPHVTDEIKKQILENTKDCDVLLVEIGGTVGDIESLPFLESARQLRFDLDDGDVLYIHLTLLPFLKKAKEHKTKPTQHSVKELRSIGIQPDFLVCRSVEKIDESLKKKIALFTNVRQSNVVSALDVDSIYEVPLNLYQEKLDELVLAKLRLKPFKKEKKDPIAFWSEFHHKRSNAQKPCAIKLVGKYAALEDAYTSVREALIHAGFELGLKVNIDFIPSETITSIKDLDCLKKADGILIPGGFGKERVEGKILSIQYARENGIPFLGICLGLQLMVVEFARNVLGLGDANSSEFENNTSNAVVGLVEQWRDLDGSVQKRNPQTQLGGTMRLGEQKIKLIKNSLVHRAYGRELVFERHRHRYEINGNYLNSFAKKGLIASGISHPEGLTEVMEIQNHPWMLASQYHPEFTSRPQKPNPLFFEFVRASSTNT